MNLKELAKARGTNLKRISEQTGVPASTLYAISQGESTFDNVGVSTFKKVAEALGMTVDELYELPNITPENMSYYFVKLGEDDSERELLGLYQKMDDRSRSVLLATARALAGAL